MNTSKWPKSLNLFDQKSNEKAKFELNSMFEFSDGQWKTSYGITFAEPGFIQPSDEWVILYNDDEGKQLNPHGMDYNGDKAFWIDASEVIHLLKIINIEKGKINFFSKPNSIQCIENIFHKTHKAKSINVELCPLHPLQWRIFNDQFSCICNPFGLKHVYSTSADDFELHLFNDQDNSDDNNNEYQSLNDVIEILANNNYLPREKVCAFCKTLSPSLQILNRCSRCKITYYCNEDCQLKHWKSGHNKNCFPVGTIV
jgi:hypothetical protein